jgi:hypothetical protein
MIEPLLKQPFSMVENTPHPAAERSEAGWTRLIPQLGGCRSGKKNGRSMR